MMTINTIMIDGELCVADYELEIPYWIERDALIGTSQDGIDYIYVSTIKDIIYGGCQSGSYMPAVTYATALSTMGVYGGLVMEHLWTAMGERPELPKNCVLWQEICCHWLSMAVESWAYDTMHCIDEDF